MRTLLDYLDSARDRAGLPSDRRLAVALGVSQPTLLQYRRGTSTPQPNVMIRLAELAGIAPETALLDRAAWQANDNISRAVMSRIIAMWHEENAPNPLNAPRSLGAAAIGESSRGRRLRYIMEFVALWASLLDQCLSSTDLAAAT